MGLGASTAPAGDDALISACHRAQQLIEANLLQEAEEVLQECLKKLERRDPEADLTATELLSLSGALCPALQAANANVAATPLAFRAAALVAWLARHGQQQPKRWNTPLLDHLQLYGRLISSAWVEGGFLTQQPMDYNRYLLLLGEIMCQVSEIDLQQRQHWTELASRCIGADLWRSGFFSTHAQSLLKMSCVASPETLRSVARATLQSCFDTEAFEGLLDRVLMFQIAWTREGPALDESISTWANAALQCRAIPGANAGCCLVAFLADRLPSRTAQRRALQPLLLAALQDPRPPGDLMKPCIYSTSMGLCGPQYETSCTLAETLALLLPPERLNDPAELDGLRRRATYQVLPPRLSVALGRSASSLSAEDQLDKLGRPLETWAAAVASHPSVGSHPARRWFCSVVFFAVGSVAKEAERSKLTPEALVLLLKAFSAVDCFREDTKEYRAILISLVQCGVAYGNTFQQALLDTFCELSQGQAREFRLFFWISVLAMAKVEDLGHAWPVLFHCLGSSALAGRALALVATMGTGGQRLREVFDRALGAFQAEGHEEIISSFYSCIDDFIQKAQETGRPAGTSRGPFSSWIGGETEVASMLQAVKQQCVGAADEKKASMLFQLLCLALRTQPAATVQSLVVDLLTLQLPFRQLFAAHVVSRFPETTRQELAGWLLRRFPDAARAFRDPTPAIGQPQPVLRSAL